MTAIETSPQALLAQLDALHTSLCKWSFSMTERIAAAHERYVLNGYAYGSENFFEGAFVSLCRHSALWRFDQFRQEAAERLHALHASPAVQGAVRLLDLPSAAAALHFDLNKGPDRDAALSNENWCSQTDEAFSHLMDCGNALQLQLAALMEDLGKHVKASTMAAASPSLLPASI